MVTTFGVIVDIIVLDTDTILLVCEVLRTGNFSPHIHAYKACKQSSTEYWIGKQKDLFSHTVLVAYTCAGQPGLFNIPLKYQLVDN
jgi:hypothetical protein